MYDQILQGRFVTLGYIQEYIVQLQSWPTQVEVRGQVELVKPPLNRPASLFFLSCAVTAASYSHKNYSYAPASGARMKTRHQGLRAVLSFLPHVLSAAITLSQLDARPRPFEQLSQRLEQESGQVRTPKALITSTEFAHCVSPSQ